MKKEELLYLLVSMLVERYLEDNRVILPECSEHIEFACRFMENNYNESISLNQLCEYSRLGKINPAFEENLPS